MPAIAAIAPAAIGANGYSTNAGALSAATASTNPSAATLHGERSRHARSVSQTPAVNRNVVHTSVITSAPKYGMDGNSAVSAAALSRPAFVLYPFAPIAAGAMAAK